MIFEEIMSLFSIIQYSMIVGTTKVWAWLILKLASLIPHDDVAGKYVPSDSPNGFLQVATESQKECFKTIFY